MPWNFYEGCEEFVPANAKPARVVLDTLVFLYEVYLKCELASPVGRFEQNVAVATISGCGGWWEFFRESKTSVLLWWLHKQTIQQVAHTSRLNSRLYVAWLVGENPTDSFWVRLYEVGGCTISHACRQTCLDLPPRPPPFHSGHLGTYHH